jgi:Cu-Zn family superoxide dismutase
MMKALGCTVGLLLAGSFATAQDNHNHSTKPVTVEFKNAQGQSVGTALLSPAPQGIRIKLAIKNLPAGEHSLHIHQVAKCELPDFKSAGPHFNGMGAMGGMSHDEHAHDSVPAGDIPNFSLIVGADGTARVTVVAPNVTLGTDEHSVFSNGGTSIVIHAASSASSGSAPARIACGVITKPE